MKSLFKRSLAAATGSVLALTQLALMANMNISAEEATAAANGSGTKVTVDAILNVPVNAEMFKNAVITNGAAEIGQSDIGNKIESALLASGDKTFTSQLSAAKAKAKTQMLKKGYIDSATADELLAAVKDAEITVTTEGKITGSAKIDECGAAIGKAVENALLQRRGFAGIKADDGTPITIDWSKFKVSGEIKIDGQIDFDNNAVEAKITGTCNGQPINSVDAAKQFAAAKLAEAAQIVAQAAEASAKAGHPATKLLAEVKNYTGKGANGSSAADSFIKDLAAIELTDYVKLDTLYADYMKKVNDAIDNSGLSERNVERVKNQENKYTPATAMSVFDNEKVQTNYDKAVNKFNEKFGDTVTWDVALSDVKTVIENAEAQTGEYAPDYDINKNFDGKAVLFIDDDAQQDDLKAAANEAINNDYTGYLAKGWTFVQDTEDGKVLTADDFKDDAQWVIKEVVAKKKITAAASATTDFSGKASLDVVRFVTKIVLTKPVESSTTETSVSTDVTVTSGTDVTTPTSPVESETNVSGSNTTAAPSGDGTTTTTAATFISFEVSGNRLVYWSEEVDKIMDISDVSVNLCVVEAGVVNEKIGKIDVSDAFKLEYDNTNQLKQIPAGTGCLAQNVGLVVKDASVIENALSGKGYDDVVAEQGIKNGYTDPSLYVTVDLVLRGDSNLNGEVSLDDAQYALRYYTKTMLGQKPAKDFIDDANDVYLREFAADKITYFRLSHYAMDTADGAGTIELDDAMYILRYYTVYTNGQKPVPTDVNPWEYVPYGLKRGHVDPKNELHSDPFCLDPYAIEYSKNYKAE